MTRYLAVPALPAEQQDSELNPSGDPMGWVVVRASDEGLVPFGDGYMSHRVATARAAALNAGRPGTDVVNDSGSELGETIARVLASDDPSLGMTPAQADDVMERIVRENRADDAALAAYDLLHARATFGRAF